MNNHKHAVSTLASAPSQKRILSAKAGTRPFNEVSVSVNHPSRQCGSGTGPVKGSSKK